MGAGSQPCLPKLARARNQGLGIDAMSPVEAGKWVPLGVRQQGTPVPMVGVGNPGASMGTARRLAHFDWSRVVIHDCGGRIARIGRENRARGCRVEAAEQDEIPLEEALAELERGAAAPTSATHTPSPMSAPPSDLPAHVASPSGPSELDVTGPIDVHRLGLDNLPSISMR